MIQTTDYVGTLFDDESNPNKITVAFTMGVKALENGYSASVILMVDAVHLAIPGKVDDIDIGAPFMAVKHLQETFLEKGGKVFVCQACMVHNDVSEKDIDSRFAVINADEVVALLMHAKGTLQLT